jgi:hypothetical protein
LLLRFHGPFKRPRLGTNNLNERHIRSLSLSPGRVLYATQFDFGVSARAYNIEERAAYGKPFMPSYGRILLV